MRVLFRTGGMLSFNLSAEGFNRHLIAIIKGQDCLAFAASHIVGLRLLEGWGHPPDNPVVSCPAGYAHGDHGVEEPRPQHADDGQGEQESGERAFDIHNSHEQAIHQAAFESGQQAHSGSDKERYDYDYGGHEQREPGTQR